MAEVALKEQMKRHSEVMSYAREVLQLLSSDELLKKAKQNREKVEAIRSKLEKGKENSARQITTLEHKKQQMKEVMLSEYRTVREGEPEASDSIEQPDVCVIKEAIQRVQKQATKMDEDSKKLEAEKRILEFHKKQRKLQKQISKVKFDMKSNEKHVEGYMYKPDGKYEIFKFDVTKDTPSSIADYFWDSI